MINKNWVSWCWQLGIFGAMIAGAIASCFDCALAQSKIVPDGNLGSERSRVLPNDNAFPIEEIRGGAIRGGNLFHSFLEFNVSVGRRAYFYSPNVEIQNILARVTGSNRSEILGTLGTRSRSVSKRRKTSFLCFTLKGLFLISSKILFMSVYKFVKL